MVVDEPRFKCLLPCSPAVQVAGMELLRLFFSSNSLNPDEVLERKHNLYLAFLRDEYSNTKVGTIPELALLSRCLLGTNKWRTAYHVRTLVNGGMWCLRGTVANWCYRTFANKGPSDNAEHVDDDGADTLDVMDDFEEVIDDDDDEEYEEDLEEQEELDMEGWPSINSILTLDVNDLIHRISSRLDIGKSNVIGVCNVQTLPSNISIDE